MEKNRRKTVRRGSDLVLQRTVEVLRALERTSIGEEADFTEAYADLVGAKDKLGRRREDREIGESLCASISAIAENLSRCSRADKEAREEQPRKIRLTKIREGAADGAHVGWEEGSPVIGQSYRLFTEAGGVIRTSAVTEVGCGFIQTLNSRYRIDVLHG
jgi:hypothetical protein